MVDKVLRNQMCELLTPENIHILGLLGGIYEALGTWQDELIDAMCDSELLRTNTIHVLAFIDNPRNLNEFMAINRKYVCSYFLDLYSMYDRFDQVFSMVCISGNLPLAQWMYTWNKHFFISAVYENIFAKCCALGHLEILQWIFTLAKHNNIDASCFKIACQNNHLELAKWIATLMEFNNYQIYDVLNAVCYSVDNAELVQWLYAFAPKWLNTNYSYELFRTACYNGHINIAKWLVSFNDDIIKRIHNDDIFEQVCYKNYVDLAKWVLQFNKYNVIKLMHIFSFVCSYNHIQSAQFIHAEIINCVEHDATNVKNDLIIYHNIPNTASSITLLNIKYNFIFIDVCASGHLQMAQWLHSVMWSFTHRDDALSASKNSPEITQWLKTLG
jgi:hypothetical protein